MESLTMINEYRGAFESFVKNKTIGPFAKKTDLSGDQVQQELKSFQETRDRYQALDQQPEDQNPTPGQVSVPVKTAFPPAPLSKEQQAVADMFGQAVEGFGRTVKPEDEMLAIKLGKNEVEVEETGIRPGVSFTRTVGNDTYYMNVSFREHTDVVEALHLNSASGTGASHVLQYVLPEEPAEQPKGTVITELDGGIALREDENGVLRWDI